jgi:hypothetical protein
VRPLFGARGLPPTTYASWRASITRHPGAGARILAWARAEDGFVVGSPAVLSIGDAPRAATPDPDAVGEPAGPEETDETEETGAPPGLGGPVGSAQDGWRHLGWHEIEHGGWNAESRSLSWTLYGGRRGRVGLAEPGRMPELFRERVAASIVVERFVPIRGERGVTVTARRDLGGSGTISWHSTLTRGLSWSTEGVADEAARASAELQSEYGSASPGW